MHRSYHLDEYRQHIEKDGALERRFKVLVSTSIDETVQILNNIKDKYEELQRDHTRRKPLTCVNLTARYITDRHLPDKAIDAMDEVVSASI